MSRGGGNHPALESHPSDGLRGFAVLAFEPIGEIQLGAKTSGSGNFGERQAAVFQQLAGTFQPQLPVGVQRP